MNEKRSDPFLIKQLSFYPPHLNKDLAHKLVRAMLDRHTAEQKELSTPPPAAATHEVGANPRAQLRAPLRGSAAAPAVRAAGAVADEALGGMRLHFKALQNLP